MFYTGFVKMYECTKELQIDKSIFYLTKFIYAFFSLIYDFELGEKIKEVVFYVFFSSAYI